MWGPQIHASTAIAQTAALREFYQEYLRAKSSDQELLATCGAHRALIQLICQNGAIK